MTKQLFIFGVLLFCVSGCSEPQLGSPENPAKFTAEVLNEFDMQIKEVQEDTSLSDSAKAKRIEQIESERKDFEAYNEQGGQDGQGAQGGQ